MFSSENVWWSSGPLKSENGAFKKNVENWQEKIEMLRRGILRPELWMRSIRFPSLWRDYFQFRLSNHNKGKQLIFNIKFSRKSGSWQKRLEHSDGAELSLLTFLCHCSFTWGFSDSGSACWCSHFNRAVCVIESRLRLCSFSLPHICVRLKNQSSGRQVGRNMNLPEWYLWLSNIHAVQSWGFQKRKITRSKCPFLKWPLLVRGRNWKHMAAYKCEFKPTTETLGLIEEGGGLHIILAIKTSGQIMVVNLLFCPPPQCSLL